MNDTTTQNTNTSNYDVDANALLEEYNKKVQEMQEYQGQQIQQQQEIQQQLLEQQQNLISPNDQTYTDGSYRFEIKDAEDGSEATILVNGNPLTEEQSAIISQAFGVIMSMFLVMFLVSLAYAIYQAIVSYRISKKMGGSTALSVLAIFFWPIVSGVLAFSKKYGKNGEGDRDDEFSDKKKAEPREAEVVSESENNEGSEE